MKKILYCLFFSLLIMSCDDAGDTNMLLPQGAPVFVQHYRNGQYPDATYDGCTDTYMRSDAADTDYGNATNLIFQSSSASGGYICRTLIRFDIIGTLPAGITIKKAVLSFRLGSNYLGGNDPDVSRVHVEAWAYIDIDAYFTPTWNQMDWNASHYFVNTATFYNDSSIGMIEIPEDIINTWLDDKQSNFGMVLMLGDETIYEGREMLSSDYSDINYRPMLSIYYTY